MKDKDAEGWLSKAVKWVARNPWVWALGEQINRYVIKPIYKKIRGSISDKREKNNTNDK